MAGQKSALSTLNIDRGKVVFILAHSQHSHISAFNNFLIICAIKLFLANSNQRHHCQPTTCFFYNLSKWPCIALMSYLLANVH